MTEPRYIVARSRTGRPVAAGGRTWGKLDVRYELPSDSDLADIWARRDSLIVSEWPIGWTDPDGNTPNPDPDAAIIVQADEASTAGAMVLAQRETRVAEILATTPLPPARTTPSCCSVGAHPQADSINRDLMAGDSVRVVAARYKSPVDGRPISKSVVHSHKSKCMKTLGKDTPTDSGGQAPQEAASTPVGTPENVTGVTGSGMVSASVSAAVRAHMGRAQTPCREAMQELGERQRIDAERVKTIADMVCLAAWKDRATVVGLAQMWGCPEDEVQRLHRIAAAKVAAARGGRRAELESSVAYVRMERDAAKKRAEYALTKAAEADKNKEPTASLRYRDMAAMQTATQFKWQQHLDKLLGLTDGKAVTLNVSYTTNPDFAEAFRVIDQILGVVAPGIAPILLEGLAIFEDRGEDLFGEWLADLAANRQATVVQGEVVSSEPVATEGP